MLNSIYLVGSNPLPIITVLSYDLGLVEESRKNIEDKKILFIYTKDTKEYYENIKEWMKEKNIAIDVEGKEIGNPHRKKAIYDEIKDCVSKKLKKQKQVDEIFINASGGTKAMSNSLNIAVIEIIRELKLSNTKVLECEIDPVKKKLYLFDLVTKAEIDSFPKVNSIGKAYKDWITIDDIVALYNYKKPSSANREFTLGTAEKTIEFGNKILSHSEEYTAFKTIIFGIRECLDLNEKLDKYSISVSAYKKNEDEEKLELEPEFETKELGKFLNGDKKYKKKCETYEMKPVFHYIFSKKSELREIVEIMEKYNLVDKQNNYAMKYKCFRYITGIWLEEYIWALILNKTVKDSQYEIQNNFIIKPKNTNKAENEFEIDLVFRKGYEITFISCTTDTTKTLANSKTYQVLANSESLGMRTKTLLVTMYDKDSKEFLERNKAFSSNYYKNLKFISFNEIKDQNLLEEKLEEILIGDESEGDCNEQ